MRSFSPERLLLITALSLSPLAHAQISPEVLQEQQRALDQEQQRLRTQDQMKAQQRRLDEPSVRLEKNTRPSKTIQLPQEATCHIITHFQFEIPEQVPAHIKQKSGTTLPQDTFYFLNEQLQPLEGQCIGQLGITTLVNHLMLNLVSRGYTTTRIGIELNQNLASGTLKFTLLPGYLQTFRFAEGASANVKTTFPVKPGEILNLRDLEQGLEQMQRVSSFEVVMQLVPGTSPGATDVELKLKRNKPWRVALTFDDSGVTSTGKLQAGANLSLDDPFGLSDILNMGVTHDAHFDDSHRGTKGANMYYSLPWGNWTLTSTASYNQSHQSLPTIGSKTVSFSNNSSFDAKVAYMLLRNQIQKESIELRVGKRFSNSRIESEPGGTTELQSQYRNTSFAEASWVHRQYIGAAKFDLTASYRFGVPWLGAKDDSALLEQFGPGQQDIINGILHYKLKIIDATLSMPFSLFGQMGNYSLSFHGQFTNTPQDGANMISIGGRYSVRGFDGDQTLAAEQGYYLRNELQLPIGKTNHSLYWGLDAGKVFGPAIPHSAITGTQLAGTVIGLRGSFFKGSSYEVFAGTPLYKPEGFNTSDLVLGFNLRQEF